VDIQNRHHRPVQLALARLPRRRLRSLALGHTMRVYQRSPYQVSPCTSRKILLTLRRCASETLVPWAEWEVQNDFFTKLNEWNRNNSQSTLDGVMKKVQGRLNKIGTVLESQVVKEILEFIPNNPFPAGHLVKCLLSVLIIGIVSHSRSQACSQLC
jgi:hypothetical protein